MMIIKKIHEWIVYMVVYIIMILSISPIEFDYNLMCNPNQMWTPKFSLYYFSDIIGFKSPIITIMASIKILLFFLVFCFGKSDIWTW